MNSYVLSADADLDLDEIWEYIAADNIDAADRWIDKLFDAFEAVGQTPAMGHRREDLTDYTVLFWPVGAYLVIYRALRRPIEIVADRRLTRHPCLPTTPRSALIAAN